MSRKELYNKIVTAELLSKLTDGEEFYFVKNDVVGYLYTEQLVFVNSKPKLCSIGIVIYVAKSGAIVTRSIVGSVSTATDFLYCHIDDYAVCADEVFFSPYSSLSAALRSLVSIELRQCGEALLTDEILRVYFSDLKKELLSSIFLFPDAAIDCYDIEKGVLLFASKEDLFSSMRTILYDGDRKPYVAVSVKGRKYVGIPILINEGKAVSRFREGDELRSVLFSGNILPEKVILGTKEKLYSIDFDTDVLFMTGSFDCKKPLVINAENNYVIDTQNALIEQIDWWR